MQDIAGGKPEFSMRHAVQCDLIIPDDYQYILALMVKYNIFIPSCNLSGMIWLADLAIISQYALINYDFLLREQKLRI